MNTEESTYRIFAQLHPHEAYYLDTQRFCSWMRKNGYPLTDEQIKELIVETEETKPNK